MTRERDLEAIPQSLADQLLGEGDIEAPDPGMDALLKMALQDPDAVETLLDKADAEESFLAFVKQGWKVLEPAREFVPGWHLEAVAEHLEAVSNGQIKRLLINIPPGCTKSRFVNVYWPAWEWGPRNQPHTQYISASYAEALAIRDNRHCRRVILSPWYQALWGERFKLMAEQNQKIRYDNSETGYRFATSVGGVATGERGDRFIIDDPHNVKEAESELKRDSALQWFSEVVTTRFNDAASAMVVIMQRVHERDVSGLILEKELGFDHLCLPMEYEPGHPYMSKTQLGFVDPRTEVGELLCPERFSADQVENDLKKNLRAWGGTYAEAGQLQQRPAPRGGGMFQKKDFQIIEGHQRKIVHRCRGWDLAATASARASWTVGVKMAMDSDGRIYVEEVVRIQGTPYEVETLVRNCAERDGPDVIQDLPQDPGQAGKTQRSALTRLLHGYVTRFSPESGSKETRAEPLAAQAQAGNLLLIRGPWNDAFIAECATFPRGKHDDQVDGASRAYSRILLMSTTQRFHFAAPEVLSA